MVWEMEQVFQLIRERFPLLQRLLVQGLNADEAPERLPPFVGMLLAAMETPSERPICFILPRKGDIGRLAVFLHALHKFAKEQPRITREFINANFADGDIVCINPGKHVFRYRGFDSETSDFIKLEALHETGGWRRVRGVDVMNRLEKAALKKPLGRLNSPIHSLPHEPIDELLGTASYGNQGHIKNAVVLLDSQSGLKDIAGSITLLLDGSTNQTTPLDRLFPFGQLVQPRARSEGWFLKWRDHTPTGEPLVAVTHSSEFLSNYCLSEPSRSRLIVVNGLSRLRNLQTYDDIATTQNLILFADLDDEEMIQSLGQRGCRFWWLTASEMRTEINSTTSQSIGLIGKVNKWSDNFDQMNIKAAQCEDCDLNDICLNLEKLRTAVYANPDGPLAKLVSRSWRVLNDACAVIGPLDEGERQQRQERVALLRRDLETSRVWLSQEEICALTNVADGLNTVFGLTSSLGVNKSNVLQQLLEKGIKADLKCALVARNEGQAARLDEWLQQHGFATSFKAYSPRSLPDGDDFNHLICVSWLGANLMKQIAISLVAPNVTILAYRFEQQWLKQFDRRLKNRPAVSFLASSEKSALLTGTAEFPWPEETADIQPALTAPKEPDIFAFERCLQLARKGVAATPTLAAETVTSRYISFFGESFAFLTETHKVAVATDFISARARPNQQLPERSVEHLKQGDFIVFPKSGDRELIQVVADKLLGEKSVELRATAHLWKDALWGCGISPEAFLRQAKELGHSRQLVTIKSWFSKSTQIGPQTEDDLALVQIITNDNELEHRAKDVWAAIGQLRSAHLSAGARLRDVLLQRLPSVIGKVEENGTEIELGGLGSAWIVQIESIAADSEPRGYIEVNRLLWEDSSLDLLDLL